MGVWISRTMDEGSGSGSGRRKREGRVPRLGRVVMFVFKLRSVTGTLVPFLLTSLYNGTINICDYKIGGLMKTLNLLEALFSSKELVHCRSEDFKLRESNYVWAHPDYIRYLDVYLTLNISFMAWWYSSWGMGLGQILEVYSGVYHCRRLALRPKLQPWSIQRSHGLGDRNRRWACWRGIWCCSRNSWKV